MRLPLVLLAVVLVWSPLSHAATRLGLHMTQLLQELFRLFRHYTACYRVLIQCRSNQQGFFIGPFQPLTLQNGRVMYPCFFAPFTQRLSSAIQHQIMRIPFIQSLFPLRSPPTILLTVWTIIVVSFNGVLWPWPWSHISIKSFKGGPETGNSPATISRIVRVILRILTTILYTRIHFILRQVGHAVCDILSPSLFNFKTATTPSCFVDQMILSADCYPSATTLTKPVPMPRFSAWHRAHYAQSFKCIPNFHRLTHGTYFLLCVVIFAHICYMESAYSATRLGLHVTQQELDIWRTRMTDTVGTINGFTYQSVYQNRILADANTFRSQSHPGGDGYWIGYTGAGCAPTDQSVAPGRANGYLLMKSAFTFLLTGDTSYAAPVRTELLNLLTVPGVDFTNTSKWCPASTGKSGGVALEDIPWLMRVLFAFDYLKAGNYTALTTTERTNITTWLKAAAQMFHDGHLIGGGDSNYPGVFSTPQNLTCSGCPGSVFGTLYFGGANVHAATYNIWFNQPTGFMALAMAMGLMTNDTTMIGNAVKFFTGYIKAGVYNDGAIGDFMRWKDCFQCLGSMWGHVGGAVAPLVATADMLARTGDTSLYDLTAVSAVAGQGGSTVSLRTVLQLVARMANRTVLRYGTTNAGEQNTNFLLTWDSADLGGQGVYWDFGAMAANLYYQDTDIHTAMIRNIIPPNTSLSCFDSSQGGCFSGLGAGRWTDLPFMFGDMEGLVDPYTLTGPGDITTNLVAYYKLNETSGTTASDSSGQNQHGTLVGFPASPWTSGHVLGGLTFDGVDDVVTVPASAVLNNLTTLSLAAWIHPTAFGSGINLRVMQKTGAWLFAVLNDAGQQALFFEADRWQTNVGCWQTPASSIALNVDTHVAVTYDYGSPSNIPAIYINGAAQTVTDAGCSAPSGTLASDTGVLHLGNRADLARPFAGWLDEGRVYGNRLLQPDDITALVAFTEPGAGPTRSQPLPSFALLADTTSTLLGVTTNVAATCRYALTAGVAYASMPTTFSTTGGTTHTTTFSGLTPGSFSTVSVRCTDGTTPNTTDFPIDVEVHAYPATFTVYDAMFFAGKPDLTSLGLFYIQQVNEASLIPSGCGTPVQATVEAVADAVVAGGYTSGRVVLDIEACEIYLGLNTTVNVDASKVKLTNILTWFNARQPALDVGYYSFPPISNYYAALYLTQGINPGPLQYDIPTWQAANDYLGPLLTAGESFYPSAYTFFNLPTEWAQSVRGLIREAKRLTTEPVFVYVWPQYHEAAEPSSLRGTLVDATYWTLQLQTIQQAGADGIVIWGGLHWNGASYDPAPYEPWDSAAPWWQATLAFLGVSEGVTSAVAPAFNGFWAR